MRKLCEPDADGCYIVGTNNNILVYFQLCLVCLCGLIDVVYPSDTFNNFRYVSLLCHLPPPPLPPPPDSKRELSSLISLSVIVSLHKVTVVFHTCFCLSYLLKSFMLSNLFCPRFCFLLSSFLFSFLFCHLVVYFGASGLFVAWVASDSIPLHWMARFAH